MTPQGYPLMAVDDRGAAVGLVVGWEETNTLAWVPVLVSLTDPRARPRARDDVHGYRLPGRPGNPA